MAEGRGNLFVCCNSVELGPVEKNDSTKLSERNAYIECGHKRYGVSTTTFNGEDSLNITEEIDVKTAVQRNDPSEP